MNSACDWASSWARAAAYGARRLWSYGDRSITYRLGTSVRPPARIALCASASLCMALRISTGWTTPLNTLAKAPSTRPSNRFSKRCSTLTASPSVRPWADLVSRLRGARTRPCGPRAHFFTFRSRLLGLLRSLLALTDPPRSVEDMMVSGRRTLVGAPIGSGMLLSPGLSGPSGPAGLVWLFDSGLFG